ncbi:MAG: hypothetical protein H6Q90_6326, partial [Deltaproteobacteria bacterium]|nr:hypothetical protein [Deltaproteobacteria bacterium]
PPATVVAVVPLAIEATVPLVSAVATTVTVTVTEAVAIVWGIGVRQRRGREGPLE